MRSNELLRTMRNMTILTGTHGIFFLTASSVNRLMLSETLTTADEVYSAGMVISGIIMIGGTTLLVCLAPASAPAVSSFTYGSTAISLSTAGMSQFFGYQLVNNGIGYRSDRLRAIEESHRNFDNKVFLFQSVMYLLSLIFMHADDHPNTTRLLGSISITALTLIVGLIVINGGFLEYVGAMAIGAGGAYLTANTRLGRNLINRGLALFRNIDQENPGVFAAQAPPNP